MILKTCNNAYRRFSLIQKGVKVKRPNEEMDKTLILSIDTECPVEKDNKQKLQKNVITKINLAEC
jgi:hypothetical protein